MRCWNLRDIEYILIDFYGKSLSVLFYLNYIDLI